MTSPFRHPCDPAQRRTTILFLEICKTRRIMSRMPHGDLRKVFLVVAGGNTAAERHFEDTIQRTRTVEEVRGFLRLKKSKTWKEFTTARTLSCGEPYLDR